MDIRIEPLSAPYLERACDLVDECFPHEPVHPDLTVRESMDKRRHLRQKILNEYGETVDAIDFWIAIDSEKDSVVGTSGLYEEMHDEKEASWMEWFCVHPTYRGHGVGEILFLRAIEEAKKRGKKFVRVYTDMTPSVAHDMYERHGFRIIQQQWDPTRKGFLDYMEKRL